MNNNIKSLLKIQGHIHKIMEYTKNKTYQEFIDNTIYADSTLIHIIQIGEIVNYGIDDQFRRNHGNIKWNDIYAMRNKITHNYDSIDYNILYETIKRDIPELLENIENLLK